MFATKLPGLGYRGGSAGLPYVDIDDAKAELARLEGKIATLRARQVRILAWLDAELVARVERSRSMEEWTAGALDIAPGTARDLVTAARAQAADPLRARQLESGDVSFDRVVATNRLVAAGGTADDVAESRDRDLVDVRRRAAALKRVTRIDERQLMRQRHISIVPTLDNTAWKISGLAPAAAGHIIAKALDQRTDGFAAGSHAQGDGRGARCLDALTALSQDYLDGTGQCDDPDAHDPDAHDPNAHDRAADAAADADNGYGTLGDDLADHSDTGPGRPCSRPDGPGTRRRTAGSSVTVFLDAGQTAAATGGELGATIAAGPRIGPDTLDAILCGGAVSLVTLDHELRPVATTRRTRAIPPAIRDFVLQRDGRCVMDGCRSRYRLEPHHLVRYSDGGTHDPDNLVTLCWYHHHVAVHGYGERLDPESPPHRRRFLRPAERRALEDKERRRRLAAIEAEETAPAAAAQPSGAAL